MKFHIGSYTALLRLRSAQTYKPHWRSGDCTPHRTVPRNHPWRKRVFVTKPDSHDQPTGQ